MEAERPPSHRPSSATAALSRPSSAASRVSRQGTFTRPDVASAGLVAIKRSNAVAPLDDDDAADAESSTPVSAFENDAYDDDDDDATVIEDAVSTLAKSKSEGFSTDTYKKSKSNIPSSSQQQRSFVQRLVESAKVAPHQQPTRPLPKSDTVGSGLDRGAEEDDADEETPTRPYPAPTRSISASPTFVVEKGGLGGDVVLDRISSFQPVVDEDADATVDDSAGAKSASLPNSPTRLPLVPFTDAGNKQMYIPLTLARDYIGKMSGEMKVMKENHLSIVQQIEEAYRKIEDETQNQFVVYVQGLKQHYVTKIINLRGVLDVHKKEIFKKESYWESSIKSLQERNRILMKEKNAMFQRYKEEVERLEKEKKDTISGWSAKLDWHQAKYAKTKLDAREKEKTHQEKEKQLEIERGRAVAEAEELTTRLAEAEAELKKTRDSLKAERLETTRLKTLAHWQMTAMKASAAKGVPVEESSLAPSTELEPISSRVAGSAQRVAAAAAVEAARPSSPRSSSPAPGSPRPDGVARSLSSPRPSSASSSRPGSPASRPSSARAASARGVGAARRRSGVPSRPTDLSSLAIHQASSISIAPGQTDRPIETSVEKEVVEELMIKIERIDFDKQQLETEKAELTRRRGELQEALVEARKEAAVAKAKLEAITAPTSAGQSLRPAGTEHKASIDHFPEALKFLLVSDLTGNSAREALIKEAKKLEADVESLKEDVGEFEGKIRDWEKSFEEKEHRAPSASDQPDSVADAATMLQETRGVVASTEAKIRFFISLSRGEIPEAKSEAMPSAEQLVVRTVEIEVADPKLVEELDQLKEKLRTTESFLNDLEIQNASLRKAAAAAAAAAAGKGEQKQSSSDEEEDRKDDDESAELKLKMEEAKMELRSAEAQLKQLQSRLESEREKHESLSTQQKKEIERLTDSVTKLEEEKTKRAPIDAQAEMKKMRKENQKLMEEVKRKNEQMISIKSTVATHEAQIDRLSKHVEAQKALNVELKNQIKLKSTKGPAAPELGPKRRETVTEVDLTKQVSLLQARVKELESKPQEKATASKADPKADAREAKLKAQAEEMKKALAEKENKIKELQKDLKAAATNSGAAAAADKAELKKKEKLFKDLEKKTELTEKKLGKSEEISAKLESDLESTRKELESLAKDHSRCGAEIEQLQALAEKGNEFGLKVQKLESEIKELKVENVSLTDNYNSERVLRKKYFNAIEDMKGKIRVFCRSRPLSKSELERGNVAVINSPDEFTINVQTSRGPKEFAFDRVFMPSQGQESVFEDSNNLIQSAVDGFNVCIFAYGQTGSGKTYTMIGDRELKSPGIAPRAFRRVFEVIEENRKKFEFRVSAYMMELYNDRLLDLLINSETGKQGEGKHDVKLDKKGMVYVTNTEIRQAANEGDLMKIFDEGSRNRHVASTKMNAESSRSHLIIGIIIESTNRTNGNVLRGKLSLVDLAGSERVAKTGASAEQLKEANSINRSLSALGDVISALSTEQSFIPYRNNKLTQLMQDSLGGNAKTLMFVNISPADYNADETVISLTYAARVKLITNDASKNADNKEIARLKGIIAKMKMGEKVEEEL